jgi:hypothetical protein
VSIGAVCAACNRLLGLDVKDLEPPPEGGTAADSGTLDATEAACVNLLPNGGFEDAPQCAPWTNYGRPSFDSTPTHSGANACGLCVGSSGGAVNFGTALTNHPFLPGEALHVELWVRAKDDALNAAVANLAVGTNPADLGYPSTLHLSADSYQRLSHDILTPLDGGPAQIAYISLIVSGRSDGGGDCILVDDVVACQPDGG